MLADNGIILGNISVSDQSHREQQTKQTDQQYKMDGCQAKMDRLSSSKAPKSGLDAIIMDYRYICLMGNVLSVQNKDRTTELVHY